MTSETEENVAYSPFSLHIILSLLSHGARDATANVLKTKLFHSETDMVIGFKHLMSLFNVSNLFIISLILQSFPSQEWEKESERD